MCRKMHCFLLFLLIVLLGLGFPTRAQTDTTQKLTIDSILLRQKGILGRLAQNLLKDTLDEDNQQLLRNDKPFQQYKDRIIRHIKIQRLEFGVSIADTTQRLTNKLTRLSNNFHRQTRDFVISNNLFFAENETLSPFQLGDNEKHLRDLPFIQDAKIIIEPVEKSEDSIDIIILTKDVLSIGGSFHLHNSQSADITIKEDNFFGWGDRIQLQSLYDLPRDQKFGYGFAYIKRNIRGTFIDGAAGYLNFDKAFSSNKREERIAYLRFVKPLVNRYMQWTYGLETEIHNTQNFYNSDSLYFSDFNYKYNIFDVWGAWNMDADKIGSDNDNDRIRRLIGLRVLKHNFSEKPLIYSNRYFYRYADLTAVMGDITIFKQNFYKTQYIYGFGRNEDVPEGGEASFTAGWTKKHGRERPYAAINFQRYYFTSAQHYFNYTFRSGSYFYNNKLEDINILANVDYFSRLYQINEKWKRRIFISLSAATQINSLLNEPLVLESEYGLQEFKNNNLGGNLRITLKGESVFFSPWSVLFFKFAPFVFANTSFINIQTENSYDHKLFSVVGGGIRTRNESLIFGTIELKGMFFPRKNFFNDKWLVEFNTNIRFKYNREFIKRAEFVRVN